MNIIDRLDERFGDPWKHPVLKWIPTVVAIVALIVAFAR